MNVNIISLKIPDAWSSLPIVAIASHGKNDSNLRSFVRRLLQILLAEVRKESSRFSSTAAAKQRQPQRISGRGASGCTF